ncbi:glycosyltransferase [Aeromonas caviae]|uniref:glycosyltransferase n=1 Tax=Aeromonas caviae TaxID=648 RepID=UPI003014F039
MIKLDVSISIVTYNANMSMLSLTLNKLKGAVDFISDNDVEINTVLTLIDHSPFPDSMVQSDSVFQSFGCGSKLINDPLNPGFGAGHNRALLSETKYHLILNPDLEVAPDALKNALEFMERHPECGLLTPFATWADGEVQRLCKGYPTVFDLLLRGFAPAFVKRLFQTRLAKYEMADQLNNHDVLWDPPIVSGCFMLFRTDVLQQLEGFDPRFFLYFEDFDISLRAGRVSRIAYVPQVKVVHHGGHASRKGWRHIWIFGRSMVTFFNIHGWRWW